MPSLLENEELYENIITVLNSSWSSFVGSVLVNFRRRSLSKMPFWGVVKIAHKVTTNSVDRLIHNLRSFDDSPCIERKAKNNEGKWKNFSNRA